MPQKPEAVQNTMTELMVRALSRQNFTNDLLALSFLSKTITFFTYDLISFYEDIVFHVIVCSQLVTKR